MKKKNLFCVFLFCITIFLGCAGTPEPDPPPTPAPAPAPAPAPTPVPEITVQPQPPAPAVTEELVLQGSTRHVIIYRDTLSQIAARAYGHSNMFYFPLIRLANASQISNPDVIIPGINLIIPDLQANLNNPGARRLLKAEMLSTATHYDRLNIPEAAARLRALANEL